MPSIREREGWHEPIDRQPAAAAAAAQGQGGGGLPGQHVGGVRDAPPTPLVRPQRARASPRVQYVKMLLPTPESIC